MLLAPVAGRRGSLDACAQRVIRDWYSGGRVDDVYPLACYRAAIRALPDDVLQYSNADQDIAARSPSRARAGRPGHEDARGDEATPTRVACRTADSPTGEDAADRSAAPAVTSPTPAPVANADAPPQLAERVVADTRPSATSVPYPIARARRARRGPAPRGRRGLADGRRR